MKIRVWITSEDFQLDIILSEHFMELLMKIQTLNYGLSVQMIFREYGHNLLLYKRLKHVVKILHIIPHTSYANYGIVSDFNPGKIRSEVHDIWAVNQLPQASYGHTYLPLFLTAKIVQGNLQTVHSISVFGLSLILCILVQVIRVNFEHLISG